MKKQQAGFTLIELIMVIVILGILSAFALPRFANLSTDANRAVLEAGLGATKSANAIAHSAWLAGGSTASSIDLEGATVNMSNGYPTVAGIVVAAGLGTDFATSASGTTVTISPADAASAGSCLFTYTEATSTTSPPTISAITSTGC